MNINHAMLQALSAPAAATVDLSEDALAAQLTAQHGARLLYVPVLAKWFRWTGTHFQEDNVLAVFDDARQIVRDATDAAGLGRKSGEYKKVRSSSTIAAIEKIARTDPAHATTINALDSDKWLLNTPGTVIDLRTGAHRANSPADRCTKITAVAPGGDAPTWRRVLEQWTNGDAAIAAYLQRLVGYSLTGSTQEHALCFLYGTGANGKSAFLRAVTGCLNSYAVTAPISTFTESKHEQHPTDLARLRGARLVTTTETEANRTWAEAKVKTLTGGDRVAARFMRQDFFEYDPEFTLIVAGNHRPRFTGVDESIRRRLQIVPFSVTIPVRDRDPHLDDKLRAEWPGILTWALEGCRAWQCEGLNPPAAVLASTADFLEEQDSVGAWIAEGVIRDPNAWTSTADAFLHWQVWASSRGEAKRTSTWLAEELKSRGFTQKRTDIARGFSGLRLVPLTFLTDAPHIDVPRAPTHTRAHAPERGHGRDSSESSEIPRVTAA